MDIKNEIRIIENFPKEGISFKDITTLIGNGEALKYTIDLFADYLRDKNIDAIVGPEARGFIFGVPVAYALGVSLIPVRKKGKLPFETESVTYDLEYGTDTLEIHKDAIKKGLRVAIIDDLLATGGTIAAVSNLVEKMGGEIVTLEFLVELTGLKGRDKLKKYDVKSFVEYEF